MKTDYLKLPITLISKLIKLKRLNLPVKFYHFLKIDIRTRQVKMYVPQREVTLY